MHILQSRSGGISKRGYICTFLNLYFLPKITYEMREDQDNSVKVVIVWVYEILYFLTRLPVCTDCYLMQKNVNCKGALSS